MTDIKNFRLKYAYLSNMYRVPLELDGITYQSAEAAYQAQKCVNEADKRKLSKMYIPEDAYRFGRTVLLRPDWEGVKIGEMRRVIDAKFKQNPNLAGRLLATGDAMIENGDSDAFWGTVNGEGRNELGKILMLVRGVMRRG